MPRRKMTGADFDQLDQPEDVIHVYHMLLEAFVKLDFLSDKDVRWLSDHAKLALHHDPDPALFGVVAGVEKAIEEGVRFADPNSLVGMKRRGL